MSTNNHHLLSISSFQNLAIRTRLVLCVALGFALGLFLLVNFILNFIILPYFQKFLRIESRTRLSAISHNICLKNQSFPCTRCSSKCLYSVFFRVPALGAFPSDLVLARRIMRIVETTLYHRTILIPQPFYFIISPINSGNIKEKVHAQSREQSEYRCV